VRRIIRAERPVRIAFAVVCVTLTAQMTAVGQNLPNLFTFLWSVTNFSVSTK
jgi:hypothetical protein